MTAATFEDATTLEGAPRPLVEDAWVALNKRYAIGAAAMAAALLLLWAIGMGPGASRPAAPAAGPAQRAADVPAAASRPAPAGPVASTPSGPATAPSTAAMPSAASAGAAGSAAAAGGANATNGADPTLPKVVPGAPVARLYFEPDQAWPTGEVGPRLAPVLARLKTDPDAKALVSGFHDARGSVDRNAALAKRRAETVRRVLIREGIAADRIVLAKPQQTTGSGAPREARRVEVAVAR